jgi:hypothetical protein
MIHFFWFPWGPEGLDHSRYENANREIVKGAWRYFGDRMRVHHMNSVERIDATEGDILIGAPSFPYPESTGSWMEVNHEKPCYSYAPWVNHPLHRRFIEPLRATRLFFAMCGSIWYDKAMQRPPDDELADICARMVRVNMGCDANLMAFRHDLGPRTRGFLHMSDLRKSKDPGFMYEIFDGLDATLNIGSAHQPRTELPNVVHLGNINNALPEHERLLLETSAFYIHTSWTDAQATAILENCARGLVPLLTHESGFASEHALYFKRGDTKYNRDLVLHAKNMSDEEYTRRSVGVREQVLKHHNWAGIYKRIEDVIMAHRAGDTFDRRGGSVS